MRKILGTLALVLMAMLGAAPVALAVTPTDIVVEDTAGVLDRNTLLPAVRKAEFYDPTKVAIFTYRGTAATNLNEEVLRFARTRHPEWISADGQKWADGLYIFALDPTGRHVGTYMGEDRKVSPDQRDDIQNSTKDLFRDAQWTEGTIVGIQRGAELINQPWYRSWIFIAAVWTAGIGAACGAIVWLVVRIRTRSSSREELGRGDRSYSNVSMDLEVTELNANTIPESSTYGAMVLEKHRSFLARYNAVTVLANRVHAMSPRDMSRRRNLKVIREYTASATELDALDDVIADTNALLNRAPNWPPAWDRQVEPLRQDLDGLEELLSEKHAQGDSATAAALRSFRDSTRRDLEQWAGDLKDGRITPETALDRLKDARTGLSVLLKNHADTVISSYAKNEREAKLMHKDMEDPSRHKRSPSERAYEPSILGTVYPTYFFFSVQSFDTGFSHAQSSVISARGGGTTGYGSSGGSFSGSGSSSGF